MRSGKEAGDILLNRLYGNGEKSGHGASACEKPKDNYKVQPAFPHNCAGQRGSRAETRKGGHGRGYEGRVSHPSNQLKKSGCPRESPIQTCEGVRRARITGTKWGGGRPKIGNGARKTLCLTKEIKKKEEKQGGEGPTVREKEVLGGEFAHKRDDHHQQLFYRRIKGMSSRLGQKRKDHVKGNEKGRDCHAASRG